MTQTRNGKSFEYALSNTTSQAVINKNQDRKIDIIKDKPYDTAYKHFCDIDPFEAEKYNSAARVAIESIINLEPRLTYPTIKDDTLIIKFQKDNKGEEGDSRDIVFVSSMQNWEIGISAKTNHAALKHSRLSNTINFGKEWLDIPCSNIYFDSISPIFDKLHALKREGVFWGDLEEKKERFYVPTLLAFKEEVERLCVNNQEKVASEMFKYLIGRQDYYKIIRKEGVIEIQIFNIYDTLNKSSNDVEPYIKVPKLRIPHIITDISLKKNSKTTLIVTFYPEWKISLRIHSAKKEVEPSLKFDASLTSIPESLHTIVYEY